MTKSIPTISDTADAKKEIGRLERKREHLREKRKDLDESDQRRLEECQGVRKRFQTLCAVAMSGSLALAGGIGVALGKSCDKEKTNKSSATASDTNENDTKPNSTKTPSFASKNHPRITADGEFKFAPVEGIMSKVKPVQTCTIDPKEFKGMDTPGRFVFIMDKCDGRVQKGGETFLKTTVSGYKANGTVVSGLDKIFMTTGAAAGLPQVQGRTFLFHRNDGKDGLPGGNVVDFRSQAMTSASPGISHSFTSIPLDSDKAHAVSAIATEICQSRMLAEKDDAKAEITCNSYGKAAASAYAHLAYDKYAQIMRGTAFMLDEGGPVYTFQPINPEAYGNLQKLLRDEPDILIPDTGKDRPSEKD